MAMHNFPRPVDFTGTVEFIDPYMYCVKKKNPSI